MLAIQQEASPRELQAENTWLSKQNSSLEAQLEQVTASLADLVDSKARADSKSLSQTQARASALSKILTNTWVMICLVYYSLL